MYLNSIEISNIGLIAQLNLELEAPEDKAPFPLVFVGTNGLRKKPRARANRLSAD